MADVLGLPGIGIHDDFFALGGHSLLAAQLTARLNRELGVKLRCARCSTRPTVARLAEKVACAADRRPATPAKRRSCIRAEQHSAPLSLMQERLRFLEQLHPGRVVYNTPSAHRLRGPLDVDAFDRAFARDGAPAAVACAPAIAVEDGEPVQVVHAEVDARSAAAATT